MSGGHPLSTDRSGDRNPHQEMPSLQKTGNGLLSDIGESCSEMFFPFNNPV